MVMLFGGDRFVDGRRGQPYPANHVDDVLRCVFALRVYCVLGAPQSGTAVRPGPRSRWPEAAGGLLADASAYAHIDG